MKHKVVLFLCVTLLLLLAFGTSAVILKGYPANTGSVWTITYWYGLVDKFQTLFAGILAVAAALVTVYMSEHTERKNAERHNALMRVQTRADRLEIERLTVPQTENLLHAFEKFRAAVEVINSVDAKTAVLETDLAWPQIAVAQKQLSQAVQILTRPAWIAGEKHFDGALAHDVNQMKEVLPAADALLQIVRAGGRTILEVLSREAPSEMRILRPRKQLPSEEIARRTLSEDLPKMSTKCAELITHWENVANRLKKLGDDYR